MEDSFCEKGYSSSQNNQNEEPSFDDDHDGNEDYGSENQSQMEDDELEMSAPNNDGSYLSGN